MKTNLKSKHHRLKTPLNFKSVVIFITILICIITIFLITVKLLVYLQSNQNKNKLNAPNLRQFSGEQQSPQVASPAPSVVAKTSKFVTASDHIRGNVNAKVTLVEYFDFECPFCRNFTLTLNGLLEIYGDKIRVVYRHYPLPFHANSQKEAEASECVANLGGNDAFWKFSDALYEGAASSGTGLALDSLGPLAEKVGVNQTDFKNCLDSGKFAQLVKDDIAEGDKVGVNGNTPTILIVDPEDNTQLVVGVQPIGVFKNAIDKALAE